VYTAFQASVAIIASIFFDIAAIWCLRKMLKANELSQSKKQQEKSLLILVNFLSWPGDRGLALGFKIDFGTYPTSGSRLSA
jgi:hypothetical protein